MSDAAYQHCLQLATSHYENFPVASRLLPKQLRKPIAAIYAFARTADDMADEGQFTAAERLSHIATFEQQLAALQAGHTPNQAIFIALKDTITRYQLPYGYFWDLLTAFKQDIIQNRYQSFADVLKYCRYSANPVGRLLLHLQDKATPENVLASDAVCTALQLINFLQDIRSDYQLRNRIYLPEQQMQAFNVTEMELTAPQPSAGLSQLIMQQLTYIRECLQQGEVLKHLRGRFGLEIRLILAAAHTITTKLEKYAYDFCYITQLQRTDYVKIIWRALRL